MHPELGIIMLTVRDNQTDLIAGLDAGADDYVTKPFRLPELAARIRATIRRIRRSAQDTRQESIEIGSIKLDPMSRRVTRDGVEVHLTPKEFELLHMLMSHAGVPLQHGS